MDVIVLAFSLPIIMPLILIYLIFAINYKPRRGRKRNYDPPICKETPSKNHYNGSGRSYYPRRKRDMLGFYRYLDDYDDDDEFEDEL